MMFSFNNLAHREFVAPFNQRTSNREQNSWQQLRKSQTLVKVGFTWVAKLDSNDLCRAREADTFSAGRGMFRRIPPQRKHKMTQDLLGRPFWRKNKKRVLKSQLQGSCLQVHRRMWPRFSGIMSLNTISFRHFGSSWIRFWAWNLGSCQSSQKHPIIPSYLSKIVGSCGVHMILSENV